MKRILREDMFDVGDEKFLMLLLVMKTENEHGLDLRQRIVIRIGNEIDDAIIDVLAVTKSFFDRRPRDQAAQVAPMHVPAAL